MDNIIKNEKYHAVFERYGTPKLIERDWVLSYWKDQAKHYTKSASQFHFNMKADNFPENQDGKCVSKEKTCLQQVNRKDEEIDPLDIYIGVPLKTEKLCDVEK